MRNALLLALLLVPCAALAQAGRFLLAVGEVAVVRGGSEFRPASGTPIQAGDLIRLGERSNAQIRLSDESIVALRAGTQLRIDAYTYTGKAEESRSFFSLLRGGLRTVTGTIGNLRDRERYRVRTPTATIGIRGTHYVLLQCDNDCGAGAQNGTYGGVSDGSIGVENQTGERQFGVQEFFHVASADAAPQGLIAPPAFLYDRLEGQERSRGRQGAETSENMARAGLDAESRPSDVPAPPEPPAFIVTEQRDATGNLVVLDTLAVQGGVAFATTIPVMGRTPDIADLQEGQSTLTLDETGTRLEAFSATNDFGDSVSASRGSASFADTGGTAAGDVFWGRWTPGAVANVTLGDDGPLGDMTPTTGIHWIFGDATPPATIAARAGSVSYTYVGGTNPTDGSGAVGTMDSANSAFTVDFTSRGVSGDLAYTVGGVTYAIAVSSTIRLLGNKAIFTDVRDAADVLAGSTCTACGGLIDATSVGGMFHGPTGNGLGVTFATDDATAGASAGAAYFGAAPPAPPPALAFGFSAPDDDNVFPGAQFTLALDGTGTVLESFAGAGPYALDRNGAAVADIGGDTSVATVRWGRWGVGGQWTHPTEGISTPPTGVHWMFGDASPFATVASRTGSVIYQHAGGTNPTDHAGNVGTMLDSSIHVDFFDQLVSGSINYAVGGVNYNLAVPEVPISQSNGQAFFLYDEQNTGGFCSACPGTSGSYSVGGTFMGPQGDGIATTWGTHHGTAGQTAGAAYFTASAVPAPTTALVLALLNTANPEGDDPAAFAVQSHLTTVGTTLNAFNVPSHAHIDPTGGPLSGTGGTVTNETTANAIGAYWGRWAGGSMTEILGTTTFSNANQLHYVVGPLTPDSVIAGKTGTFAFNLVGGTTPTNSSGETGSMTAGTSLSVDFTARTVAWPATTFAFTSNTWSFPTTTSNINVDATRGAAYTDNNITGSCAGAVCTGGPTARLVRTGVFMGPAGDHLGVSFAAKTATSGASMQASGLFACTPPC